LARQGSASMTSGDDALNGQMHKVDSRTAITGRGYAILYKEHWGLYSYSLLPLRKRQKNDNLEMPFIWCFTTFAGLGDPSLKCGLF
jgi:hypothetical protein